MIDIAHEIDAVQRTVGTGRIAAGEAKVVSLRRTYQAGIDDVWDALTTPERIGRWFLPVSGDLRLGGRYQLQGQAGGTIVACERPNRLQVTWVYPPSEDESGASEVELRLTPAGAGATTLELVHTAVVPDEMWDTFGPGAVGVGWEQGALGLALYLATGSTVGDPEAWQVSDEGRAYASRSSEGWGAANLAAGADAEVVARNVAATTAFYTGEPAPGAA
jgi:uncharacterized protein YndB with AHSA1/START domain